MAGCLWISIQQTYISMINTSWDLPPFFLNFKIWWIPFFFCMSFSVAILALHWDFPCLEINTHQCRWSLQLLLLPLQHVQSLPKMSNQKCLILLWNYQYHNQYLASRLSTRLIKAHWDYRSLLDIKCSEVLRFWTCTSKIEHENFTLIRKIFQFRKNNSIQTWYTVIR